MVGVSPLTPEGQCLFERGRMVISQIHVTGGQVLTYSVYMPSGQGQVVEDDRAACLQMLLIELSSRGSVPQYVGGDWNLEPAQNIVAAALAPSGWTVACHRCFDDAGCTPVTYVQATARSTVDDWMLSKPSWQDCQQYVIELPSPSHRLVVMSVHQAQPLAACPVVPSPVSYGKAKEHCSEYDWTRCSQSDCCLTRLSRD